MRESAGLKSDRLFFLISARTAAEARSKIPEIESLGFPYVIVCGEECQLPGVIYRKARGKWDAINFGAEHVKPCDLVCLNDADTRIVNLAAALDAFDDPLLALTFCKVSVTEGPQRMFYRLLDLFRRAMPLVASGELMIFREEAFRNVLPLEECKTEDNLALFKVMRNGGKVRFIEDCYTITNRTETWDEETAYKRRTVSGIYHALSVARPPFPVKAFYFLLPLSLPAFLLLGRGGLAWISGILQGLVDFLLRRDRGGKF